MQYRLKGWSQPAVRRGGRECVGLRACNTFLPSPEETAASGTSPENSDGATFPQTPLETHTTMKLMPKHEVNSSLMAIRNS